MSRRRADADARGFETVALARPELALLASVANRQRDRQNAENAVGQVDPAAQGGRLARDPLGDTAGTCEAYGPPV